MRIKESSATTRVHRDERLLNVSCYVQEKHAPSHRLCCIIFKYCTTW